MALESNSEVNFSDSKFNSLEEAFLDLANKYKSEKRLSHLGLNACIDQLLQMKMSWKILRRIT